MGVLDKSKVFHAVHHVRFSLYRLYFFEFEALSFLQGDRLKLPILLSKKQFRRCNYLLLGQLIPSKFLKKLMFLYLSEVFRTQPFGGLPF